MKTSGKCYLIDVTQRAFNSSGIFYLLGIRGRLDKPGHILNLAMRIYVGPKSEVSFGDYQVSQIS